MNELELLRKEVKIEKQLEAIECKKSFFQFVRSFWDVIIPENPVWNWHIEYLCNELQIIGVRVKNRLPKDYDLIINIPPGTTKSTIATVMYPVWTWIIDPTQTFITSSHDLELSTAHAVKSRDIIKSQRFKEYFGTIELKTDQDNKRNYQNNSGGSRIVASVGSNVTGKHAHQLIVDDPLNPEKAASEVGRNTANRWMDTTLSTRKVDKELTPTIVVMQRLHEVDVTGHLLSKGKKIKHICLPAEESILVSPKYLKSKYIKGLLDPIRLNENVLRESKKDLGSYGYANQFDQSGAPLEGGIFKKDWFRVIKFDEFIKISKGKNIVWNYKLDGAYTDKTENDPCGIWASCVINNTIYVRDFLEGWFTQPEYLKTIKEWIPKNGYSQMSKIKIEPKANGISTVQTIKRETILNVSEYKFPKTKKIAMSDSKVTRANACSPSAESGRVVFIDGAYVRKTLTSIINFPNAAHDEAVDCMVMDIAENFIGKPKGNYDIR